jgi:hypothetical protein
MDDNNKMQVTEIFDVTDSESHTMLSIDEVDTNKNLQFDDWDEPTWLSQHTFNDSKSNSNLGEEKSVEKADSNNEK